MTHEQVLRKLESEKILMQDTTTYRKKTADYVLMITQEQKRKLAVTSFPPYFKDF